jgi:hypothetical protein
MSLSVCFLTRNEAETIGRAVRSVAPVADEILVVDTHSRDQTAERAAEAGARVLQFDWIDDFGAGRNFTISQATGDWVLWINGTEELTPESPPLVREAVSRSDVFGYFVRVLTALAPDRTDQPAVTMDLRLFRRRPDLRFIGRAHPHFEQELADKIRHEGFQVLPSGITLRTTRYDPPTESKLRWSARLYELELQDRPGQLHYMIELGMVLLSLNDPKGHERMAQAAEHVAAIRNAPKAPNVKVQALLVYLLTAPPGTVRSPLSRDELRELALRWFPASPHLLHIIAEDAFNRRDFRLASTLLERLLHLGRTGTFDRSHIFDPELIGDRARINLGHCYLELGEALKAEQCYRPLLNHPHYGTTAARGLATAQQLQQRLGRFSFDINDLAKS